LDKGNIFTKFYTPDKIYLEERKKLSKKYGKRELWQVIDPWALYVGISNLAIKLSIADLLRSTLDVPGHVAEFGSWRGDNLLFMAKILRIYDPYGSKYVHCFDSFQGLTEFTKKDGISPNKVKGLYKGSYEELLDFISLYKMKSEVIIHKGIIEKTLPKVLEENKALSFSFVYCDTDLYSSTKVILESLHDRLSKGGLFVLDEWNHENFHGEGVAVNEFLKEYGHKYKMRHIRNTRQPNLVLEKIEF
jgi:SAM-dependent methyltransferase